MGVKEYILVPKTLYDTLIECQVKIDEHTRTHKNTQDLNPDTEGSNYVQGESNHGGGDDSQNTAHKTNHVGVEITPPSPIPKIEPVEHIKPPVETPHLTNHSTILRHVEKIRRKKHNTGRHKKTPMIKDKKIANFNWLPY